MHINTTLAESIVNNNNNRIRQIPNNTQKIICYVDSPPEYEDKILSFIDTPPKYEEGASISAASLSAASISAASIKTKTKTPKKTENNLSKRKGKCCYSKESHDSRCCGACYLLCPSNTSEEQCEFCHNNFCDYWKSGYIQTTDGINHPEDRCPELECDDCCCTTCCFPLKFPIFFPCCLGSVCNEILNKLCGSNTNYLF